MSPTSVTHIGGVLPITPTISWVTRIVGKRTNHESVDKQGVWYRPTKKVGMKVYIEKSHCNCDEIATVNKLNENNIEWWTLTRINLHETKKRLSVDQGPQNHFFFHFSSFTGQITTWCPLKGHDDTNIQNKNKPSADRKFLVLRFYHCNFLLTRRQSLCPTLSDSHGGKRNKLLFVVYVRPGRIRRFLRRASWTCRSVSEHGDDYDDDDWEQDDDFESTRSSKVLHKSLKKKKSLLNWRDEELVLIFYVGVVTTFQMTWSGNLTHETGKVVKKVFFGSLVCRQPFSWSRVDLSDTDR